MHIHVRKGEAVAKLWLEPEAGVAEAYEMTSPELYELLDVAIKNKEMIERYWNEHFNR